MFKVLHEKCYSFFFWGGGVLCTKVFNCTMRRTILGWGHSALKFPKLFMRSSNLGWVGSISTMRSAIFGGGGYSG